MTHRERVQAALRHEQPDRTPFNIGFTHDAYAALVEYTGDPAYGDKIDNSLLIIPAYPSFDMTEVAKDVYEDPYGVQWDRSADKDIGVVCNRKVTLETIATYAFPQQEDAEADVRKAEEIRKHRDKFVVADLPFSLFERAWALMGMEDLLIGMMEEPDLVHLFLDRILEFNLQVIERACALDIDAMMFGDDWGMQTGIMMGDAHWREFIKPRIRQMYGAVKRHGKHVFIHSCGKVDSIFPDLIECGLDVFNPFQPEVIDVCEAKKEFGHALTFYGGISTQRTLPYGTPAQVRDEVRRLLDVVGRDGGLIAAPAHSIPGDAKPENIIAMLEVLQEG